MSMFSAPASVPAKPPPEPDPADEAARRAAEQALQGQKAAAAEKGRTRDQARTMGTSGATSTYSGGAGGFGRTLGSANI